MTPMHKDVGLWIDHRHALIVTIAGSGEEIRCISSHLEKEAWLSPGAVGHSRRDFVAEDMQERRTIAQLDRYYGDVINFIRDAESIAIFGPGQAKRELANRIESIRMRGRIVTIESAEHMTEPQLAAKVRARFPR
jgi:hypothetical protein